MEPTEYNLSLSSISTGYSSTSEGEASVADAEQFWDAQTDLIPLKFRDEFKKNIRRAVTGIYTKISQMRSLKMASEEIRKEIHKEINAFHTSMQFFKASYVNYEKDKQKAFEKINHCAAKIQETGLKLTAFTPKKSPISETDFFSDPFSNSNNFDFPPDLSEDLEDDFDPFNDFLDDELPFEDVINDRVDQEWSEV